MDGPVLAVCNFGVPCRMKASNVRSQPIVRLPLKMSFHLLCWQTGPYLIRRRCRRWRPRESTLHFQAQEAGAHAKLSFGTIDPGRQRGCWSLRRPTVLTGTLAVEAMALTRRQVSMIASHPASAENERRQGIFRAAYSRSCAETSALLSAVMAHAADEPISGTPSFPLVPPLPRPPFHGQLTRDGLPYSLASMKRGWLARRLGRVQH